MADPNNGGSGSGSGQDNGSGKQIPFPNSPNQEQLPNYNVDDILAEFSSGKYRSSGNVVEFRDPKKAAEQRAEAARLKEAQRAAREQELAEQRKKQEEAKKKPPAVEEEPKDQGSKLKPLPVSDDVPSGQGQGKDQGKNKPGAKQGSKPSAGSGASAGAGAGSGSGQEGGAPGEEGKHSGARRSLGDRLSALKERANNYADHMYEDAEPDDDVRKAEKYLPGTDYEDEVVEDEDAPRRIFHLKRIDPATLPPDMPPGKLAEILGKGLSGQKTRLRLGGLLVILLLWLSLDTPLFQWDSMASNLAVLNVTVFDFRCMLQTLFLFLEGLLCVEVLLEGGKQLVTLQPHAETLVLLAWCFTLADGLTVHMQEGRTILPYSCVAALCVWFAFWGTHARREADRLGARVAASVHTPYIVSLDENMWNAQPAYNKRSDTTNGIGSVLQAEDGPHRVYRTAGPLLLLAALLCSIMASVGQGSAARLPWAASAIFSATATWTALLVYGLPYRKITNRLNRVGAALAGWPGISRCARAGILMTDLDLFPPGTVTVTHVNVFGKEPTERVVGYTATMIRALDCGLHRPFYNLLKSHGALYREVSGVVVHEGGISGVIRNQDVLVGTSGFMHIMKIPLPPGQKTRNTIFCAIDKQLAGSFPLSYTLGDSVAPSITALIRENISPILATRDPNIVPEILEQKYHIDTRGLNFPSAERRLELSARNQDHDPIPVAVLSREGLTAYCDAVLGGTRLHSCTRYGTIFSLISSILGLLLTFYLTSIGAADSLTIANFLTFMAAWLVPTAVLMNWVNRY